MGISERLLEDAEYHKETAHCCDCNPEDTINWRHAENAIEASAEIERLRNLLEVIGNYAHDRSTGPAVPDDLWEIRGMAYGGMSESSNK